MQVDYSGVVIMEITYLGHSSFRIKGKDAVVVTDPFDPNMVGLKYGGVTADIVTISHSHADHNKSDLVKDVRKIVDGPGEYEISGVSIIGFQTYHDNQKGAERGLNTVYVYEMDGIRLMHLGDLGHTLKHDILDELGDIDVLFVPVGGTYTLGPSEAAEVVTNIEPNIVIPMHYKTIGLNPENFGSLETVDKFLSDNGLPVDKQEKLVIKKEDIKEDEQKVVVLSIKS